MFGKYAKEAFSEACAKGFFDSIFEQLENAEGERKIEIKNAFACQLLMGVCEEIGEAYKALREGNRKNFNEEIADCFIRLLTISGYYKIQLDYEISKKMATNKTRNRLHNKLF
jgi:NTP pyrophosphatase (non-canonical NTP hydrolase)